MKDRQNKSIQLDSKQIGFVRLCVMRWLMTKEKYNKKARSPDATHSALLARLLEGKSLLPDPPPIRFSYPDYDLAEGKAVQIHEIWESEGKVVIDQNPGWKWADKKKGVLMYKPTGDYYTFTEKDRTLRRLEVLETCKTALEAIEEKPK